MAFAEHCVLYRRIRSPGRLSEWRVHRQGPCPRTSATYQICSASPGVSIEASGFRPHHPSALQHQPPVPLRQQAPLTGRRELFASQTKLSSGERRSSFRQARPLAARRDAQRVSSRQVFRGLRLGCRVRGAAACDISGLRHLGYLIDNPLLS